MHMQPDCALQERSARLQERSGNGVTVPVELHIDRDMKPPVRPHSPSRSLVGLRTLCAWLAPVAHSWYPASLTPAVHHTAL